MKLYIDKIIVPYVNYKRKEMKLPDNQPALLTFDNFNAQTNLSFLKLLLLIEFLHYFQLVALHHGSSQFQLHQL